MTCSAWDGLGNLPRLSHQPAPCISTGCVFIRRRLSPLPHMKISEIHSKPVLLPSKIYDHVVDPYAGCRHGCVFCYARFMKRFTGHKEPWGEFVDVKVVAPDLQRREITHKRAATMVIWYGVEV